MLEPAFLRHDRVPRYALLLGLDHVAVKISDADRIFCQHRDLAVAEEENVSRVLQDRRDVGRDEELAVAKTDHHRRAFANGDDGVRFVDRDDRQCENALQFFYCFPDRELEGNTFLLFVMTDQVSDNFGIGFGLKIATVRCESFL